MRGFQVLLSLTFLVFAALQYNDPDPWVWMTTYVAVAAGIWASARGKPWTRGFYLGFSWGLSLWAWALWPGRMDGLTDAMSAARPWVENARESLGLLLAALTLTTIGATIKLPYEDEV